MVSISRAVVAAGGFALLLLAPLLVNVVAANGPAASWSFDEGSGPTATDGVGNLHGAVNTATWVSDGAVGSALRFDGNDRVTIHEDAVLSSPEMTVRLWVRGNPESPPADGQVILEKGDLSCTGGSYALVVDDGHVVLRYREAAASGQMRTLDIGIAQLPSLWDGNWHQIAFTTRDEEWGSVGLYQQGWSWGTSPAQHAIAYQGLSTHRLAIGGPAGDGCSSAGFTGEIDQVSIYPRIVPRSELATAEPVVATSIEMESLEPLVIEDYGIPDDVNHADIRISPTPLAPGRLSAWLTAEDGIQRGIGARNIEGPWQVPPDGRIRLVLRPEDGGDGVLEFRWEPSLPQLGSKLSTDVTVAKSWSQVSLGISGTYIEGDSIVVGARVSGGGRINPNGTVELREIVGDESVLLESKPVDEIPSSFDSHASFTLPPRDDGTYLLEARYLGGTAHLPSDPWQEGFVVHQALITGEVRINGGDAVTDNEYVTVELPAVGAVAVQLSLNPNKYGQTYVPMTWEPTKAIRLTNLWDGEDQDGLKTVWVTWADAKGHWTEWSSERSDSIVLDRGLESGTVTINDGAATTSSHAVIADVPVDNPSAVESVQLSNDGESWTTKPYDESVTWQLAGGEGERTVHVRWVDALGRQSVGAVDSIIVVTPPPTVSRITATLVRGGRPTSTVPVRVAWDGDGSGSVKYDVAVSRNGGAWSTVATRVADTSTVVTLASGNKYKFRVRGRDQLANTGTWYQTRNIRLAAFQEGSAKIAYRGRWKRSSGSYYWRGASRYAKNPTATSTFTFKGTSVAWVAPVGRNQGAARVFVDGSLVQTVDLWAAAKGSPRVVFERSWASAGSHKVRIEVVGTSGRPRVDVDGFVILGPP